VSTWTHVREAAPVVALIYMERSVAKRASGDREWSAPLLAATVCLALVCFAANSLLCRAALREGAIDAQSFTLIRVFSGALFLALLALGRGGLSALRMGEWRGAAALLAYAYGFSFSYLRLDAGIGALILFGAVQATMLGWGIRVSLRPARTEWMGLGLALVGLVTLTVPGKSAPDLYGVFLMVMAGVAWGTYSLLAKGGKQPMYRTAGNFLIAAPASFVLFLVAGVRTEMTGRGVLLAVLSGAITSGLGYSVWYAAVPKLGSVRAAIVQLSVPILAMLAASGWMAERYSGRSVVAGLLTIAGVGLALAPRQRTQKL
jgi:drug/metabolite transporter (DMT)-like permease